MNLWLRLIGYFLTLYWRPGIDVPDETSVVRFRVWPHDLDTSLHLNNGRYLQFMDQGRLDLIVSGGLLKAALKHRWTPIASAVQIRFRRELLLWEKLELRSRILGWRDEDVVIEQVFVPVTGPRAGHVAARALFSGGLYDRKAKAFVPVARMMHEIGIDRPSPELPPEAQAFLESNARLRDVDRPQHAVG